MKKRIKFNHLQEIKFYINFFFILGSFSRHYNHSKHRNSSSLSYQSPQQQLIGGSLSSAFSTLLRQAQQQSSTTRNRLQKQHSNTTRDSLSQNDSFESNGSGTNFLTPTRGATALGLFSPSHLEGGYTHLQRSHSDAQEQQRRPSCRLSGSSPRHFVGADYSNKLRKMYRRPSQCHRIAVSNTGFFLFFKREGFKKYFQLFFLYKYIVT